MEVINAQLAAVGVMLTQYPTDGKDEIAFIGRSNVGKSSLINTMMNRKALARTSSEPGKTRTINFYDIDNKLYLVDLPGYGYAKVSRVENKKLGKMIEMYFSRREQLKKVCLLVDMRHDVSDNDKLMYDYIKYFKKKIVIVGTKHDKLKVNERERRIAALRQGLKLDPSEIIVPFSSLSRQGRTELWEEILKP